VKKQDLNTIFITVVLSLLSYLYVLSLTIKKYARLNGFVELDEQEDLIFEEDSYEVKSTAEAK